MNTKAVSTLSPENLADRQKGLGGSDAAVALGLSPWKTALQLYLEKTGELEPEDLSDNEAVEWGVRNEPQIRQKYADVTGREVVLPKDTVFHPTLQWMFCHPDGLVLDGNRVFSAKTADVRVAERWGEPGSADVPESYYVQKQHEMIVMSAVTGQPWVVADLAVLIGGNRWRLYHIPADAEVQELIVAGETEFMKLVTAKTAPAPDFNARSTRALIQKLFPGTDGTALEATPSQIAWRQVYDEASDKAAVYYAAAEAAKSALLFDMGAAAQLVFPDGKALRRKLIEKKAYAVEATKYIDARFAKSKE
jgi:putative phage-type endonuclease